MCILWNAILMMVRVLFVNQFFGDDVMAFVLVVFYTIIEHGGVFSLVAKKYFEYCDFHCCCIDILNNYM